MASLSDSESGANRQSRARPFQWYDSRHWWSSASIFPPRLKSADPVAAWPLDDQFSSRWVAPGPACAGPEVPPPATTFRC